jgi:hypothetical protein
VPDAELAKEVAAPRTDRVIGQPAAANLKIHNQLHHLAGRDHSLKLRLSVPCWALHSSRE